MNGTELAMQLLPPRYLDMRCRGILDGAEEIRMRIGQTLMMLRCGREYPLPGEAITEQELLRTLEKATGASLHTAATALSSGYISYHGIRIGVCGAVVVHEGRITGFRSFSSLAIRIPRECRGVCDSIFHELQKNRVANLLILSPPGIGKTTALRELIRCCSRQGIRVGVVDERWEIAASESGRSQFDLGAHCDVLSGVPKAQGAMMLLRAMNPQLIAMDEITQAEDLNAIREIVGCGVGLIATAHAADPDDLSRRPLYQALLDEQIFSDCIVIRMEGENRSYQLRRIGK